MRRYLMGLGMVVGVLAAAICWTAEGPAAPVATDKGPAAAVRQACAAGKYAFVLFHNREDGLGAVRESVGKTVKEAKNPASSIEVDVADTGSREIVQQYGVGRAILPLVLVVAPNGAVTGGFPGSCDPKALTEAMVGKTFAACLKSLQDGKLVFVAVAGTNTAGNAAAMKGADELAADTRFQGYTETVAVQAGDAGSRDLLEKLKVGPTATEPVTVLLAPPGRVVGTYTGVTDKVTMVADLMRAMAGATCGSGGCGSGAGSCGP